MIINIRGTHGSGKSTIVKTLLQRYNAVPTKLDAKKKPEGYVFELSTKQKCFVVGSYENACGGCDGIQPYSLIWPRVVGYAKQGHVIFEGALVSSSYGNIGRESEVYGDKFVFAFMNTPLQVCLDRIIARRLSKGNTKPLNPKNTEGKLLSIQGSIPKIRDQFKRRVIMLDYKKAYSQVVLLLYRG